MAQRLAVNNIWLRRISSQIISGNRAKVSPQSANVGEGRELYSPKLLKKHYEIAPLLIIVFGGIAILTGFIVRNTLTRDDIRFRTTGKFGYEEEANLDRQRKFIKFNQKYQAPEGLKELYKELKEE